MTIGVVIVTFNAQDIILDCLESLLASADANVRIVVVDNASHDDTVAVIQGWAKNSDTWSAPENSHFTAVSHGPIILTERVPAVGATEIALITHPKNMGFAGGVNIGLRLLRADPEVDFFWVLNPDCVAEKYTAARLEQAAVTSGRFGIIGGRIFYKVPDLMIQSDGGRINFITGTCIPFNMTRVGRDIPAPVESDLDYISGAHMLVSRAFLDQAGLMPEDYFLYYEEIDWCCRRGDLPIHFCAEAAVHHDGGHTLGSATIHQGPSSISSYFMGRSRMRFVRRYRPLSLPVAFAYSAAKAMKLVLKGQLSVGLSLLRGICGFKPSSQIRKKLLPKLNALT